MPRVAIVGASPDPSRYSHQAVLRFAAKGWEVWPVHPLAATIAGHPAVPSLDQVPPPLDLVCLYVNPSIGMGLLPQIVAVRPLGLWLNPGAESPDLIAAAQASGLRVVTACALVALQLGDPLSHLNVKS